MADTKISSLSSATDLSGAVFAIAQGGASKGADISLFAASQANQEAASSNIIFVTPGVQQFHPSAAKFWAFVTVSGGTPTLAVSYNVTSITDTGLGQLTVTIGTDFSSANWMPLVAANNSSISANDQYYGTPAAGSILVNNVNVGTAFLDPISWSVCGFGDQ